MAKCKGHPLDVPIVEQQLASGIRVHGLLLALSTSVTIVACCFTAWQVFQHGTNYTKPNQQRQIIRILLMVPIYAITCTVSIVVYQQHIYLAIIYGLYESLVIVSFFLLLCHLLHPNRTTLQRAFSIVEPKPWIQPIRFLVVHIGRGSGQSVDGRKWFNTIWFCVFQLCIVKVLGAIVKCITEAADVYCDESSSASHAKIWVMIIEILSMTLSMMCVVQFYQQTKKELEAHQTLLKFLAIQVVLIIFYTQNFFFSLLTKENGPIKPTPTTSYPSWAIGVPNTMLCFEMAATSIFHIFAYPHQPYRLRAQAVDDSNSDVSTAPGDGQYPPPQVLQTRSHEGWTPQHCDAGSERAQFGTRRPDSPAGPHQHVGRFNWKALVDALNFFDVVSAVAIASRWLVAQRREDGARASAVDSDFDGTSELRPAKTSDLSQELDRAANHRRTLSS